VHPVQAEPCSQITGGLVEDASASSSFVSRVEPSAAAEAVAHFTKSRRVIRMDGVLLEIRVPTPTGCAAARRARRAPAVESGLFLPDNQESARRTITDVCPVGCGGLRLLAWIPQDHDAWMDRQFST
jgi:hypothetical protein